MTAPIFLIDDDDDLREILKSLLESRGFEVQAFGDARDALARLQGGSRPSIILLDLMMPGMSGWEFCEQKRSFPGLSGIPVAVLTATQPSRTSGLEDVEVVRKPFAFEAIIELIERHT